LPSPIHGIDLALIRTGIYGAGVVAVTVLASFLWLAKAARVEHDIAITARHRRDERLGRRLVLLPRMGDSFWGPAGNPQGIQVHVNMTITNPEGHGTLFVSRVEIARGRLGRYQECNGLNILRDALTLMPVHRGFLHRASVA
jgi:hypothetical protein